MWLCVITSFTLNFLGIPFSSCKSCPGSLISSNCEAELIASSLFRIFLSSLVVAYMSPFSKLSSSLFLKLFIIIICFIPSYSLSTKEIDIQNQELALWREAPQR